jgi:hypothetical protein
MMREELTHIGGPDPFGDDTKRLARVMTRLLDVVDAMKLRIDQLEAERKERAPVKQSLHLRERVEAVDKTEPVTEEAPLPEEWVEIGKRCSTGRRSLWARWIYRTEPTQQEKEIGARVVRIDDVEAVELRAGREGDDVFVRIDRSNKQFMEIENLLSAARFAATT